MIEIKTPIEVYNKDSKEYEKITKISLVVKGREGLKKVSLFKSLFLELMNSTDNGETKEAKKEAGELKAEDLETILDVASGSEKLYDAVLDALPSMIYANFGDEKKKLTSNEVDSIDLNDLDMIVKKIISRYVIKNLIATLKNL